MPDPYPDLNWPPEPQPEQVAQERSARGQCSRVQSWLAEVTAGVRKIRELEASPAAPEALAAGFKPRIRGAVGSGFAGGGTFGRLAPGPDLADFTADTWPAS